MKTEQDVINALREVHFLERTAELSQKFKRDFSVKPKTARRDKVHAILAKLGYTSSLRYGWYDIDVRRDDGPHSISFKFDKSWVKFAFYYYENDEPIVGLGPWHSIKHAVADSNDYISGSPAFKTYEDLEEILKTAIELYKDSIEALFREEQGNQQAPIPDWRNLYHLTTTPRLIDDVFRKIGFTEKSLQLSSRFNQKSATIMPAIDRKKVFEIVKKLGYTPGHCEDFYYIKDQEVAPFSFTMNFILKYANVELIWYVQEEGEGIGGGPWILINRKLMGDREFMTPMPRFLNYDQLEQLLANVLQLWEDFKYELCASKGIAYERKDVLALENMYLATEERDLDEIR